MQERLYLGRRVEVPAFVPQNQVGYKGRATSNVFAELLELVGEQCHPAERIAGDHHRKQGREYAVDAPNVEIRNAELPACQAFEQDRGDQIPGNHEENIHADEAASHPFREGVKADHGQDGDCAQAINVRPVFRIVGV
ncbi:hypothetical protein D3C84_468690 [compost metagenome]